jgi:catechol-2,3-dioxygenase
MASVQRINHAVLYVRDATRSAEFYCAALGFEVESDFGPGQAIFLRASGTNNHHDLGLFSRGAAAVSPAHGAIGLYHLAWQVDTFEELVELRGVLVEMGALVGESDHGVSKSLYAHDPDGIEFEVVWMVPRDSWGDAGIVAPLDIGKELGRWAGVATAAQSVQRVS